MKLLLDTHTFLWPDTQPERVSVRAIEACASPDNELYLSVASAWEIQIKVQINRLTLRVPLEQMIAAQQGDNGLQLWSIALPHITALAALPLHHNDPFDRLLIAQARVEGAHLVSADSALSSYDVPVIW